MAVVTTTSLCRQSTVLRYLATAKRAMSTTQEHVLSIVPQHLEYAQISVRLLLQQELPDQLSEVTTMVQEAKIVDNIE